VGLAAAACLGWLLFTPRIADPVPQTGAPAPAATAMATPAARVALAWSRLRQDSDAERDKDDAGSVLALNDELPTTPEIDEADDAGLPLWMLDAASLAGRRNPAAGSPAKEL
jgi:hypothetical protein